MRVPSEATARAPRPRHRRRWWIVGAVVVLVVLLASLRTLATLYTDELWFNSVGLRSVWSTLFEVKVGLFAAFGALFFVLAWVNLVVTDRLAVLSTSQDPEDEFVRRYQRAVRPYAGWLYALLALVMALVAASGTVGEWQNWILFTHGVAFGVKDPEFGKDVGFFTFKLPFLSFAVNWALVSLAVVTVVVTVFHYLNGGIRPQRAGQRVRASVKAHLSVLLALIALAKAAGYVIARYELASSTNGYVEGPGYTDVHARLPALQVLFFVSLAAAVILLWNIRHQGWTLPVVAVGIWGFVALVIGVIYPAVLQTVKVNPAQSALESPYIARNITATRQAYAIGPGDVDTSSFAGDRTVAPQTVVANTQTLHNISLWDPAVTLSTVQQQQDRRGYYTIPAIDVDRYRINGSLVPVIVGARQINEAGIPSPTWVNVHLQYTHGEAMVIAPSNQVTASGTPDYAVSGVPASSSQGFPKVTQPDVYFGRDLPGWVVANTRQAELDFQGSNGGNVESHYRGSGGVQLSSFLRRAAFALRLADFNLLVSDQLTSRSRILFVRDVVAMAQKAAPFLSYDSDPYPVLVDGHIDWVLNAFTTTSNYPYAQNANTALVPAGSSLPASFNYIRNSVAVVVDAYSGKMTFYALDESDPILRTYEQAFPQLFTPMSKMPATLQQHLRYPADLFAVQAAMYGRYHISSPTNFYNQGDAWRLSPTPGVGSYTQALAQVPTRNGQGQVNGGATEPMTPLYQVQQLPGQPGQALELTEAYVPVSNGSGGQTPNLAAFISASSDPAAYGRLHVYEVDNQDVVGPALVDAKIQADSAISSRLTFLDQNGSSVLLGNVLMVPLGQSMLYVRPVYVTSTRNAFPTLQYVIAVFNNNIAMDSSLNTALSDVLLTKVGGGPSTTNPSASQPQASSPNPAVEQRIKADIATANMDYQQAQQALASQDLGSYEDDVRAMGAAIADAERLSQQSSGAAPASPSTTTTTAPTPPSTAPSTTEPTASTSSTSSPPAQRSSSTTTSAPRPGEALSRPRAKVG